MAAFFLGIWALGYSSQDQKRKQRQQQQQQRVVISPPQSGLPAVAQRKKLLSKT